jgi:hypothetical protein
VTLAAQDRHTEVLEVLRTLNAERQNDPRAFYTRLELLIKAGMYSEALGEVRAKAKYARQLA